MRGPARTRPSTPDAAGRWPACPASTPVPARCSRRGPRNRTRARRAAPTAVRTPAARPTSWLHLFPEALRGGDQGLVLVQRHATAGRDRDVRRTVPDADEAVRQLVRVQ